ncbi:hypothetical protein M670_03966 [Schinkia azotoformans MEV2011]|uniref:Uncharacterized protein n=1 Tax=Schinkia azotoformans MEV2011 TaxID=1348973 RepID=A0A072NGP5_SCHAZ|nr:hypothetical protein [Schinkia azotoformans]KEF36884.1 hypothetical protein M670_03966 [Schinkia azotoformans MEV2011]MEC1695258.1 hypothetical protein [Schinkia azotoformans]MEC1717560.1 hypothetical protein [Schinkia azotoformans]MEC1723715.1 hypothetical protein [Schinkia azotoformans]MEC1742490.1 hypothetical protein [Schinkia azotoformans]
MTTYEAIVMTLTSNLVLIGAFTVVLMVVLHRKKQPPSFSTKECRIDYFFSLITF